MHSRVLPAQTLNSQPDVHLCAIEQLGGDSKELGREARHEVAENSKVGQSRADDACEARHNPARVHERRPIVGAAERGERLPMLVARAQNGHDAAFGKRGVNSDASVHEIPRHVEPEPDERAVALGRRIRRRQEMRLKAPRERVDGSIRVRVVDVGRVRTKEDAQLFKTIQLSALEAVDQAPRAPPRSVG